MPKDIFDDEDQRSAAVGQDRGHMELWHSVEETLDAMIAENRGRRKLMAEDIGQQRTGNEPQKGAKADASVIFDDDEQPQVSQNASMVYEDDVEMTPEFGENAGDEFTKSIDKCTV